MGRCEIIGIGGSVAGRVMGAVMDIKVKESRG